MENLRRRVAFKLPQDDDIVSAEVLDDEQQDEVIESLQQRNQVSNDQTLLLAKVLVGLSTILHILYFRRNPLLSIYPTNFPDPALPIAPLFSFTSLVVHAGLALHLLAREVGQLLGTSSPPTAPTFRSLYGMSLLGPTLALCASKPWQTVTWWLFNPAIVITTQLILDAVEEGNNAILALQHLKYRAPGA